MYVCRTEELPIINTAKMTRINMTVDDALDISNMIKVVSDHGSGDGEVRLLVTHGFIEKIWMSLLKHRERVTKKKLK